MSQFYVNSSGPNGQGPVQTLTGNTGGAVPPTANNINVVGGTGIIVVGTPGTSTLTINAVTDSFTWTDKAVTFDANIQNGYFCTAALTVNLPPNVTFPAALTTGATIIIYIDTASAVVIQASTGQKIEISAMQSNSGGTATSNAQGNIVTLVFRTSDSTWHSTSSQGTFTLA